FFSVDTSTPRIWMVPPVDPAAKLASSKLAQLPAFASEKRLTVHCPFETVVVTEICVQASLAGTVARCSAPPQFLRARYAAFCPPPERTQTRAVYEPLLSPVSVWVVSQR